MHFYLALLENRSGLPLEGMALVLALLVLSLGAHEAAHGWVALKCGDTTARDLGRITLNPIVHIDLFMTIVLPAVLYFSAGMLFGGAKPVPVNFYNLRKPYRDMALVALAGPLSNFLLAIFFALCQKVFVFELGILHPGKLGDAVLQHAQYWNLLIAAFNLLPIPPLDGSRIMTWILPQHLREAYVRLERMGLILVVLVIMFVPGVLQLVREMVWISHDLIIQIVTLGGAW